MEQQPMPGTAPEAPPQEGGQEQAMAIFDNIMQAMNQVADVMESAPPEIQQKFQAAQAAYQEFMMAFTGGGAPEEEASQRMAPEQGGNPDVVPAR